MLKRKPVYGGAHSDARILANLAGVKIKKDRYSGKPNYSVSLPDVKGEQADPIALFKDLGYTVSRWDRKIESDGYTEIEMSAKRTNGQQLWVSGFAIRFSDEPYWYLAFTNYANEPSIRLSFEYDLRDIEVEDCMVETKRESA